MNENGGKPNQGGDFSVWEKLESLEASLAETNRELAKTNRELAETNRKLAETNRELEEVKREQEASRIDHGDDIASLKEETERQEEDHNGLREEFGNGIREARADLTQSLESLEASWMAGAGEIREGFDTSLAEARTDLEELMMSRMESRLGSFHLELLRNLTQRQDCTLLKESLPTALTGSFVINIPGFTMKTARCNMDVGGGATVILRRGHFGTFVDFDRGT